MPGTATPESPLPPAVGDALRAAAAHGTRIASICSGTFALAATGLLDGLRATTHWIAAARLAAAYPDLDVDPDVLYVDNGQFLTSAGAAAGLDLCLHLIRRDYGSAVAADAARLSVMPLEREGGQAQFIVQRHPPTPRGAALEPLLTWMRDNLSRDLTLADSPRTRAPAPAPSSGTSGSRPGRRRCAGCTGPVSGRPSTCWRPPGTRSSASAPRWASARPPPSATASNAPPASARTPTAAPSAPPATENAPRRRFAALGAGASPTGRALRP